MTATQGQFTPKDDLRKQLRYHKAMHLVYKKAWCRQRDEIEKIAAELETLQSQIVKILDSLPQAENKQAGKEG